MSRLLAVGGLLLLTGCATAAPPPHPRVDTPTQQGAVFDGWAYFMPNSPHLVFLGATSRNLCEVGRDLMLRNEPHAKPSPCLPVRLTAPDGTSGATSAR